MEDDWDLQAVVRGCSATTITTATTTTITPSTSTSCFSVGFHSLISSFQPPPPQRVLKEDGKLFCFQDLLFEPPRNESPTSTATTTTTATTTIEDFHKPFLPKPPPTHPLSPRGVPISPHSVPGGSQDLSSSQQPQQNVQQKLHQVQQNQKQVQLQQHQLLLHSQFHHPEKHAPSGCHTSTHTQSSRSKRRRNQMKRVCQVPAEALSSDKWSWRKYGQKPIKGSPYPRGYYRCSTSKGCLARKQVERDKSDPTMFIVTYTAEHNHPMPTHRNSLAGSTRQKPFTSGDTKPTSTPPASPAACLSPSPEKWETSKDGKGVALEEDGDDFSISDMPLDHDFFEGLDEELAGPSPALATSHDNCQPDHFPVTTQFPWLSNSATTTAAGGG